MMLTLTDAIHRALQESTLSAALVWVAKWCFPNGTPLKDAFDETIKAWEFSRNLGLKTVKVTVSFFKPSGKWYTDEELDWREDRANYTGWQDFEDILPTNRLRGMVAICMNPPTVVKCMRPPVPDE